MKVSVGRPMTLQKQTPEDVLGRSATFESAISAFIGTVQSISGCESVMLRLRSEDDWVPVHASVGMGSSFLRDECMIQSAECMCGRVACCDVDPSLFFFTNAGSFVTNDVDDLLARATEQELGPVRGRCIAEGFKTVAVFPVRNEDGTVAGVLHVASKQKDRVASGAREALETLSARVGGVFCSDVVAQGREGALLESMTQTLLPAPPDRLSGVRFGMAHRGASAPEAVGGDFYDVVALPDGRVGMVVGDFAGHGVHVAGMAARCRLALHTLVSETMSPAKVLSEANARLADSFAPDKFATVASILVDAHAGMVSIASAGHPAPIILEGGNDPRRLAEPQLPIGVAADVVYEVVDAPFRHGDVLVAYTDGIVDSRDGKGSFFGHEKLLDLCRELRSDMPTQMAEELCSASDRFSSARMPGDDKLVLVARSG